MIERTTSFFPPLESPAQAAPSPLRREAKAYRFVFRGSAGEYFRIWIVNLALSIVTFGIYGAWAKVRTRQYFLGNTYLDGHPFGYLARPTALLRGMLIVAAFGGLYYLTSAYAPDIALLLAGAYLVVLPAIVVLWLRFRTHYTSYRGLRFGFVGDFGEAYRAFLLWPIVAVFGFFYPMVRHRQYRYLFDNLSYGASESRFSATAGQFYRIYLAVLALVLGLVAIGAIGAIGMAGLSGASMGPEVSASPGGELGVPATVLIVAVYVVGVVFVQAFLRARETNLALSSTAIQQFQLHSDLRVGELAGLYFTNGLAVVASLGLAIPWAMCRTWRYRAAHLSIIGTGELDNFVAAQDVHASSAAADVAIDIGLEF